MQDISFDSMVPFEPPHQLRNRRIELGLSQEEVALALSIPVNEYMIYEKDEVTLLDAPFQIGVNLCDLLHLNVHDFIPESSETIKDVQNFIDEK